MKNDDKNVTVETFEINGVNFILAPQFKPDFAKYESVIQ